MPKNIWKIDAITIKQSKRAQNFVDEAAEIVFKEIYKRIPVGETENLRKGLIKKKINKNLRRIFDKSPHTHLVEFGTAPHQIKTKNGGVIMHPGARPKPFIMPGYRAALLKIKSLSRQR